MPDYDDTNSGALFRNEKKDTDTKPDYTGSINVEGTECWLSAWVNEAKSGLKYMKLSATPKIPDAAKTPPIKTPAMAEPSADFDDEIPF